MRTKFGNAKIMNSGYYRITSHKEGNNNKLLHRLIWEDFYGCEIPEGYVIHHKNFNKLDNCILNLQLMRDKDHRKLHFSKENHPLYGKTGEDAPFYGRHHSEETRHKISESHKGKTGEDAPFYGRHHSEETRHKISESHKGKTLSEETKITISKSQNTTGYFRVSKNKNKRYTQGFKWRYRYYEDGKQKSIESVSLEKLEEKVKAKGLEWRKIL